MMVYIYKPQHLGGQDRIVSTRLPWLHNETLSQNETNKMKTKTKNPHTFCFKKFKKLLRL